MRGASQEVNEWIDGFLFLANRPILDFLNTKPVLADGPTELLSSFRDLERWLIASGMVTSPKTKAIVRSWRNSASFGRWPLSSARSPSPKQSTISQDRENSKVVRLDRLPGLVLYSRNPGSACSPGTEIRRSIRSPLEKHRA